MMRRIGEASNRSVCVLIFRYSGCKIAGTLSAPVESSLVLQGLIMKYFFFIDLEDQR